MRPLLRLAGRFIGINLASAQALVFEALAQGMSAPYYRQNETHFTVEFMTQKTYSALSEDAQNAAQMFFERWVKAWNDHDARALASLHTEDAVTVNRYGTLLLGRAEAEEALAFLRGPQGPFGRFVFPAMKIVSLRQIAQNVVIAQTTWSAPALGADGNTVPDQFNEMILSYTLVGEGEHWKAAQIDAHNVEKMDLPFSSEEQKR